MVEKTVQITLRERAYLSALESREDAIFRIRASELSPNHSYYSTAHILCADPEQLLDMARQACVQTWNNPYIVGKSIEEQLADSPTGDGSLYEAVIRELSRRYSRAKHTMMIQKLSTAGSTAAQKAEV